MMRARDLAEAIDDGDLSITGLAEWMIEAVADKGPQLQCFSHFDPQAVRAEVQACQPDGPLCGIPVGFKDIIDTASLRTEYGTSIYKGWQPKADAPIVSFVRRAGGICAGKTVTTELAYLNPAVTINPYDKARTPGGSSSGSVAAVAAGMLPLAFGTQTGGSVIRPASYCGVAAIKPSFRLLPVVGVKPFAPSLDTLGLIGARVVDVAFGLAAITGRDLDVAHSDQKNMPRFGIWRQEFAGAAEAASEAALQAATRGLETLGAHISDVETPDAISQAYHHHIIINNFEGAQSLAWEKDHHFADISPILSAMLLNGEQISYERYDEARGIAKRARRALHELFGDNDCLLSYAAPGVAPTRETTGSPVFNKLITLLGLPAINVPGFMVGGLPVGVQVIGKFGKDKEALHAAMIVEAALAKR